jgi:hypothetical protein
MKFGDILTFRSKISPPFSVWKSKPSKVQAESGHKLGRGSS